ncbi:MULTISPECIES: hypothetical protein [Rhodovulum]|uniref:Uncharacterized protein n=2 Tax=Rhodovulum TaxID=34008 RepID=A0A844BRU5_9RHOB|nr:MULTISPECIES: hypothetical protein [Rhodovulum]MRH22657.1 hypothetical protein [Rhodovulum strictum]TCM84785.1 hypothetical protein EV216_110103 [Rhodovulum steppense]
MARPAPITAADLRRAAARVRAQAALVARDGGAIDAGAFNVRVRQSSGTHVVRGAGIVASCTEGYLRAFRVWADKAEARAVEMEAGG